MIRIEDKNVWPTIVAAVDKLVNFVAPTYGPAGNKVIIDKNLYKFVLDDGVQVARDFELSDEAEQAVVRVIKEVAIKTSDRVGDGTTGALIMLRSIIHEIDKISGTKNGRLIFEELKKGVDEAKKVLETKSKPIKKLDEICRVARISYDNPGVAMMIASVLEKIGKDGVITIEESNTTETSIEHVEGLEFSRGYLSPYLISDPLRAEAVLTKPYILVTSYRLTNANDVIPIMNKLMEKGKRELLIIADNVESDALATLVINRVQGKFLAVAVAAPGGEGKKAFLEDVAALTGAMVFTEDKGNRLDTADLVHLGRADRAVIRQEKTTIIGARGEKGVIEAAKKRILDAIAANPRDAVKKELEYRLARLSNGVAVMKVGAPTENEGKMMKRKVENAINATKAAMNGGVVAGAGIALSEVETSSPILNKALKQPWKQLAENVGFDVEQSMGSGDVVNVVTGEKGNYMKVGVVDPTDVLVAGIESAVSIAGLLATTRGILVECKDKEEK